MEVILFVVSLTIVIGYIVKVVSVIFGHSMNVPMPILHIFDVNFSNTYIYTPAIMHQVYFWSMYAGIFTGE